jgi:hypothetical protein
LANIWFDFLKDLKMADSKISALPASTTPLAGTEVLPIVQSSTTKQVTVANLTAGRSISATGITLTGGSSNGIAYLNGSTVLTTGSTLTFNGTNFGLGATLSAWVGSRAIQINATASCFADSGSIHLGNNFYQSGGSSFTYLTSTAATDYYQFGGMHVFRNAPSGTAGNAVTFTEVLKINLSGSLSIYQATTAAAPAYVKGAMYFDTTLNKLRIGGATAWETVTSV